MDDEKNARQPINKSLLIYTSLSRKIQTSMINVLFLTDHCQHRYFDSVYLLSKSLQKCPEVRVSVASIGDSRNRQAFAQSNVAELWAVNPDNEFCFEQKDSCFGRAKKIETAKFHFLFLRVLPIDVDFLNILSRLFASERVINNPAGILLTESKEYLLTVPDLCPEMALCRTLEDVKIFYNQFSLVLKPAYGYGGKGNLLLKDGKMHFGQTVYDMDKSWHLLAKILNEQGPYLGMRFLPRYVEGDKRILVVAGNIVGASLRIAPDDSWLCNLSSGGSIKSTEVTASEQCAVEQLIPELKTLGIEIFGLDTLMDNNGARVVTEINTCCPGGFYSLNTLLGQPETIRNTVDSLLKYMVEQGTSGSILTEKKQATQQGRVISCT